MESIQPGALGRLAGLQLSPREEYSDDDMQQSFASSASREEGFDSRFWIKDAQCSICSRKFSKIKGLSRHHCRFCGKSVCDTHSSKRRTHTELNRPVRICDLCEKNYVGHDLKQELNIELSKLRAQFENISEELQRRCTESSEKDRQIAAVEKKLADDERTANIKGKKLAETVMEEQSRNQRQQGIIDNMTMAVKEANDSEKIAAEKHGKCAAAMESVRNDIEHIHREIKELDDRVDASFFKMKYRIPQQVVTRVLCDHCQTKLFQMSFKEAVVQSDISQSLHPPEKSCQLM